MNIIEQIQHDFSTFLRLHFPALDFPPPHEVLVLNCDEQRQEFGDLCSNIALTLAKPLKKKPADIALSILEQFKHPLVASIESAGPGFLNFTLTHDAFVRLLQEAVADGSVFFSPSPSAPKKNISIEFVSANPTGPLHLGHGRGGIIGDVLGNILKFLGHYVTKEFYINDAGSQIQKLGLSFKIRCQQLLNIDIELPQDAYHGEYLTMLAQQAVATYGPVLLEKDDHFFSEYAKEHLLANLKNTLNAYGIHFDIWFSEKNLHESGEIHTALEELKKAGYLYKESDAWWFRSTLFGDDKDRVVQKQSGELTYIAADIAYLKNKINRGYNELIMVLGQDHHSYVTRLQGILKALQYSTPLFVILYQLVTIKQSGELVRMSKRAGTMVTLDDIINTVGRDVARFFYLNRKADTHLEFDLELALKTTDENPVYYLQYAYVRAKSILEKAIEQQYINQITPPSFIESHLFDHSERLLIKKIAILKQLLLDIGTHHQTHLLTYYAHELAHIFNRYYHTHHVLDAQHKERSLFRLNLTFLVYQTLDFVFGLLTIKCPERM